MRDSMAAASMFQVVGSQSTRTGMAPARVMAEAHDMIVNVGMMTSSPGSIRSAATAASRAAEPLQTAIPCLRLTRSANLRSNAATEGAAEEQGRVGGG